VAPRATTPTTAAAIVAAYVDGAPVKVICARFFISRFVMTQAVQAAGVPRRPRGRPRTTKGTTMPEEPLTDEDRGLIYAAGWRNIGASFGPPACIRFTHSDGRAVSWTRDEVRAEIARFRGVLSSLPALLAVADAARELEEATIALELTDERSNAINAAYHREHAARAALWAALEALRATQ